MAKRNGLFKSVEFKSELFQKLSQEYRTPKQVQKCLREMNYNKVDSIQSAASVWKSQSAHCLEAAFFAAAVLEQRGLPPLIVSISSWDGLDHVLYVFQKNSLWGAIGRSRDDGLHGRRPCFRNLAALVRSYFEPYVDGEGRITGYALYDLRQTRADWRFSSRNLWSIERCLNDIPHKKLHMSEASYQRALKHYEKYKKHRKKAEWW